ncbi:MAG: isoprenylcysteine carboxylmethyltransferase family protein [Actinobacteria bacterium]|nr:isoprenylcysteine carboxylmethyltransferase family protein [Actinomycetota bacterium]
MNKPYAYGMWPFVAINVAIFILFAFSYLRPKKGREWRSMGAFGAFTVALFTEMYGFPLTIYILTSVLGSRYPVINPFTHANGNLWAVLLGGYDYLSMVFMFVGSVAMLAGLVIMGKAWKQIHMTGGKLVTSGLYQRVRHPQYSGIFLITIGMFIQWPTIVTTAMLPMLLLMYYRLARREEREMEKQYGQRYLSYMQEVPMFVPHRSGATPVRMREY